MLLSIYANQQNTSGARTKLSWPRNLSTTIRRRRTDPKILDLVVVNLGTVVVNRQTKDTGVETPHGLNQAVGRNHTVTLSLNQIHASGKKLLLSVQHIER